MKKSQLLFLVAFLLLSLGCKKDKLVLQSARETAQIMQLDIKSIYYNFDDSIATITTDTGVQKLKIAPIKVITKRLNSGTTVQQGLNIPNLGPIVSCSAELTLVADSDTPLKFITAITGMTATMTNGNYQTINGDGSITTTNATLLGVQTSHTPVPSLSATLYWSGEINYRKTTVTKAGITTTTTTQTSWSTSKTCIGSNYGS